MARRVFSTNSAILQPSRRRALGTRLTLPDSFKVPDPVSWGEKYPAAAAEVVGLRGCRTLDEASSAAEAFISPLLAVGDPGFWDPVAALWKSR